MLKTLKDSPLDTASAMHVIQLTHAIDPCRHAYDKPIYAVEPYVTRTGTPDAYLPKGSWVNPQKRNWKKFEVSHSVR
jgi:hypothetical protein